MPKYYLHYHGAEQSALDTEGTYYADLGNAVNAAISAVRDIVAFEAKEHGVLDLRPRIDIEDAHGANVYCLRFAEVFQMRA